jgi:hypothetical protein
MNPAQARHLERLGHLRESFAAANERLVTRLRNAPDEAARHSRQREGWSASQIGWHVAKVTNRFAGLISGELPGVEPLPADFRERAWPEIVRTIPERLQAPEGVRPPPVVTRIEAIALLEASGVRMARALDLVTPERGAGYGIRSPIVGGLINVYQIGEWATAHVIRHNKQAKQLLGG